MLLDAMSPEHILASTSIVAEETLERLDIGMAQEVPVEHAD